MSISKTYSPQETESKWYSYWLENRFFASQPNPDKEPYCVVIPPPNVTGVLHMGHMLNNTIQDVLVRKARMEGKEACWVPGTDHASIATEAKVVSMLRDQGIQKKDLTREEFLGHAMEWKDKYGGIILEQLKKLGCSCDWDRTRFTMDTNYYNAVIQVFVDLYNKGHIYRGIRMVNWDPQGLTALSDEEVIMKEVQQKLCYIKYEVVGMPDTFLTIATVRPETIMADAAICVHPDDERYKHLHNKKVRIPLINKEIPVITDEYVTMDFGTGCLKVTPAHDLNDYELGIKHNLPVIDILNEDGKLNEKAQIYVGVDRFDARKQIIKELEAKGLLEKVEEYKSNVGTSERTGAVVEPRLSLQWFMKMKELSKPALENVMNDNIQLHPAKFKNTYKSWMENVKDWCISRQLWWGQRIPAFYMKDGRIIVANNKKEALKIARNKYQLFALSEIDLVQDEDVLDTWFSSWLWPFEVFDGLSNPGNADVKYYYPTNDLVTAPEILFFWVARMAIAGYEYFGEKPFSNVYLTGIVRDKLGRKMSKSLGNSPDPLDLIAKYGADGVRTGMLFSSPAGNDLPFDEKLCEQGRNFSNKIWNAFRLVKGWDVADLTTPQANTVAIAWFEAKLNASIAEIKEHFDKFRISDALLATYKLIWDDFCAWYLEMIKPAYQQPIDRATLEATINFFEQLMELVHPFMPFITEEIWHEIRERKQGDSICVAKFPQAKPVDATLLAAADQAFEVIAQIRNLRNSKQISPKVELALFVKAADPKLYIRFGSIIMKLANTTTPEMVTEKPAGTVSLIVKSDELYVSLAEQLDAAKERENLLKELDYTRGFMDSVVKKLANEKFVANAKPDLLERERQKLADAEAKLKTIEEALAGL